MDKDNIYLSKILYLSMDKNIRLNTQNKYPQILTLVLRRPHNQYIIDSIHVPLIRLTTYARRDATPAFVLPINIG